MQNKPQKKTGETASQYAYRTVGEAILTLRLPPGSPLDEEALSAWLQISRTPLREALFRLQQEHLVEIVPQKESKVTLIDFSLIHQALFLRSALEPAAIEQASALLSDYYRQALEENLNHQQAVLGSPQQYPRFFQLDNQFHQLIYTAAGLEHLWDTITHVSTHYNRLRYLDILRGSSKLQPLYFQHKELLQCILDKKTQRLEPYVARHLSSFQQSKLFLEPEFASYFVGLSQ